MTGPGDQPLIAIVASVESATIETSQPHSRSKGADSGRRNSSHTSSVASDATR